MSPKTLVAIFTEADAAQGLARAAASLARRWDAHLTGLAVTPDPRHYPGFGAEDTSEMLEEVRRLADLRAETAHKAFEAALGAEDARGEWRAVRAEAQTVADAILETGRAADLLLMARPEGYVAAVDDMPEQVIRALGRPVLMLPGGDVPDVPARRALIGWHLEREAARAAFDSLPLLAEGAEITLLNVGAAGGHELADGPMNDLAVALGRHGLSVTVTHREPLGDGIAATILDHAARVGAPVICAGAYGRARAYEAVSGAITRELLSESPVPVLFSS